MTKTQKAIEKLHHSILPALGTQHTKVIGLLVKNDFDTTATNLLETAAFELKQAQRHIKQALTLYGEEVLNEDGTVFTTNPC